MKFDLTGQTPSRYTRTFYLSTHQGYPFCSQYIELWIKEYHIHYGLGQQWKLMERSILLQTLFLLKKKKKTEQDVTNVAIEHVSKRIENEKCSLVYEVCYIMIINL